MVNGVISSQESATSSNNLLNEFCNFNGVHVWNKTAGNANASILNNNSNRVSYFGDGCVSINFSGNGQVSFNAGGTQMQRVIQRTGRHIISYAFDKTDIDSDITFIVEVWVNGVLQPNNTITQNLFDTSGYVNNQWNVYYQYLNLSYGDVIDFSFKAQSDTTSCYLYFDRLKLEFDNKGQGVPSLYSEAPLDEFEEENTLTVGTIANNSTIIVTASLTGATTQDYIAMQYPSELNTLGLIVGYPIVFSNNVIKFSIHNHTGGSVTPTADSVYNFKVIRWQR